VAHKPVRAGVNNLMAFLERDRARPKASEMKFPLANAIQVGSSLLACIERNGGTHSFHGLRYGRAVGIGHHMPSILN
jgi:hypothetical protein